MNRIIPCMLALFLAAGLAGCDAGSDPKENLEVKTDTYPEPSEAQNKDGALHVDQRRMQEQMNKTPYTQFELEAVYSKDQTYTADIDRDGEKGNLIVTLQDDLKNKHFDGMGAFDIIYPKLKQLSLQGNEQKKAAISQVLKAFGLPSDYQKIEISLIKKDGTKIEYED